MKILIVTDLYLPHVGGVLRHIQRVTKEFVADGNEIAYLVPSPTFSPTTKKIDGITVFGINCIPLPTYPDLHITLPFQNARISKIISEFKPDVIHIHSNMTLANMALHEAKKNGIPTVGTNHYMSENLLPKLPGPSFLKKWLDIFIWKDLTKLLSKFDYLTTPTRWGADYLKEKGVNKEVNVISNGIDLTVFNKNVPAKRDELIKKYNLPKTGKVALYVGRIDKEKNIGTLIKAVKLLRNKLDVSLVLTGKGTAIDELQKLVKEINIGDRVYFTSFVENEDLPSIYRFADLFIISSIAELQSLVTLEAMATGLPVLAADAGALPELVKNNVNGFLFDPHDAKKLAEDMMKILSDKKMQLKFGLASLKIVSDHDVKKSAKKFEDLYRVAISKTKEDQPKFG